MGRRSYTAASEPDGTTTDRGSEGVAGKSTRTEHLEAGPWQGGDGRLPFMDVMLASSPAPTGAPVVQRKRNELATFNDLDVDPRTGLLPHQERAMETLVSSVEASLATWETQRGTPNLIFKGNVDVSIAFRVFRKDMVDDRSYELVLREAARRMKSTKIPAYAREIRMFNPAMLLDLKGLLDLGDVEGHHTYEFRPLWGAAAGLSGRGIKAGAVAKTIEIRYTNDAIPGLSWTQQVKLEGIQLGFGLGVGKTKGGASLSGPGKWETAEGSPRRQYLAPDFFDGADFTSPSASASVSMGPASAKKGFGSALRIENHGGQSLLWDLPADWKTVVDEVEVGVDEEMDLHEDGAFNPELGAEAVNEFGRTSLDGDLEFEAGEWGDIENPPVQDNDTWVPLHYARIFFETGSAALDPDHDFTTVQKLVDAIKAWDKKPGYRGSKFRVEISGCHSQKWDAYDDKLRALDERRDADGELRGKDINREGDLLAKKEIENYELALARARNTHMVFTTFLDRIEQQMVYGVMANSSVAEPTTHEPMSANPYGNRDEERSATILVSYQIFSKHGQVNWNSPTY